MPPEYKEEVPFEEDRQIKETMPFVRPSRKTNEPLYAKREEVQDFFEEEFPEKDKDLHRRQEKSRIIFFRR